MFGQRGVHRIIGSRLTSSLISRDGEDNEPMPFFPLFDPRDSIDRKGSAKERNIVSIHRVPRARVHRPRTRGQTTGHLSKRKRRIEKVEGQVRGAWISFHVPLAVERFIGRHVGIEGSLKASPDSGILPRR